MLVPKSLLVWLVIILVSWWPVTSVVRAFHHRRKQRQYSAQDVPRYPNKDPIFGMDFFFATKHAFETNSFLEFNENNHRVYGRTYQATEMGKTVIKSVDPEVSKAFHSTHFQDLGVRPGRRASGLTFFGPSITNDDGHFWQLRRAWLRPSFERVHVVNFERLRKHIVNFMALLPKDDETVDLGPLFSRLNIDVSSEFIFGESLNAIMNPDGAAKFQDAFSYAVRGVAIKHVMGPYLMHLHRDPDFAKARDEVYKLVDARVDEVLGRRKKRMQQKDQHDLRNREDRLRLVDELTMETQDRLDLRYLIIAAFNPAHKQMGITLTNVFFLLARHPEVYKRLRAEVLETAGQPLSYELLKSYKLVNYTIKETLRLLPIVSFNQREALHDTVWPSGGGADGASPLYLPKGTVVEIHYRTMHRRREVWGSDAEEFRPDRWKDARPGYAYLPFGGGPRICPAQELVTTEVAFMLVTMLRTFKAVENRDPVLQWEEKMEMGFQSANGAKVALYRA